MTKREAMLEVAYDIVAQIHCDICREGTRPETDETIDLTMDIMRKMLLLSKRPEVRKDDVVNG